MAAKTRRNPVVVATVAAVLAAGGLYGMATLTRSEDERVVRFRTHWQPADVKASVILMGREGSPETLRNENSTFNKVRNLRKGDIAILDVSFPRGVEIFGLTCSIKVGAEAPKQGVVTGNHCRVDKYVS